jgi:hypothetical protein
MRNFLKKYPLLVFIIALAFMVRIVAGYVQSFSNDELSALYRLQYDNFYDLIYWGVQVDNHPAFTQLFLYFYELLVPKGEIFIRLPFIIATSVSLGYVFFAIKKLSGEFAAYMVTIILAFAGFSIQLGYFARPYAFGILFTSAATYYWIRVFIEKERSKKYLIFFILCAVFSAYTHYLALLQIAILGMATFIFAPVRLWWKIAVAGILSVLGFLPHYTITKYHLSVGGIGAWLGKAHDYFIIDVLFEYFDRSAFVLGAFLIVCMVMICLKPTQPKLKNILILGFLSFPPFLILYFYSVRINPLLQYSACFFLMPWMLGSFFSIFENDIANSRYIRYLYLSVIGIFLTSTFYFYNAFLPIHFAEFKHIAEYIEEHESDSVTTVVAVNNPFFINYYLKDKKPDLYITDMYDNLNFLKKYLDTCKTQDFIYAFTNDRSNGEIPYMIQNKYKDVVTANKFMNSEMYHFSNPNFFAENKNGFQPLYEFNYHPSTNSFKDSGVSETFYIDSNKEFYATFEIDLEKLKLKPYNEVVISVSPYATRDCDFELVLSIEEEGKTVFWKARKFEYSYNTRINKQDTLIRGLEWMNMGCTTELFSYPAYFALGENLNDDRINLKTGKLKAYIWNPRKTYCRISRFSIRFYEGNPHTTGYSQ